MPEIIKTMKLHICPDEQGISALEEMTLLYRDGCNLVSEHIFNNGFLLNAQELQKVLYYTLREEIGLKSQMAISCIKTATARYKTVQTQMSERPYRYKDENGKQQEIPHTLEWLMKPICFCRPQADLVRGRDYSFVDNGTSLSLNTLKGRLKLRFDKPECFEQYFDGSWDFGTGKVVSLLGEWYFHIPMTKKNAEAFRVDRAEHVVGLDRGLRFLVTAYDEKGNTTFFNGKKVMETRDKYQKVRAELQARGTKSAKRRLKELSGRENRWMTDVNHRLSKTLVQEYGSDTLFILEDLTGVSFDEENLGGRNAEQRSQLRSWTFYQLQQFLEYKAKEKGSFVLKVPADYTSQRCPKCGRIHKENRNHKNHLYTCDRCGYKSNDDRIGAMNLQVLGTLYVSGDMHPRFRRTTDN